MKNNILDESTVILKPNNFGKIITPAKHAGKNPGHVLKMFRCTITPRNVACAIIILTTFLCTDIPNSHAQTGKPHYGVSVAVLPFEVFSIGKEPTLGAEVAELISKNLALNPSIICVDSQQINTVMQPDEHLTMTEARLRQLAKMLNANCIVIGTITKIRAEHSIDVEMFNTASSGPNLKTFAEGLEIKSLVETITTTLDQEIMEKAEQIPAAERPKVKGAMQPSPQTQSGGFDVDRELLAAFGPIKAPPLKSSETSAVKTEGSSKTAPTLTEETLQDDLETVVLPETQQAPILPETHQAPILPETQQAPILPEEKLAAQKEEKQPQKTTALKNKKDSGFFSLSKAISINADSMEYDNQANKGIFKGNVVARQDDIVMFASSMHVYYSEGGGLSRVDARGNVRVIQGDRIATGNSIIFNNTTQTIVATGSPRVWQGDNVVHGTKITVYLKEERTVVEGDPNSRASATIYPKSDKKQP
jgi:lipopolysaccharide export system protein LptA